MATRLAGSSDLYEQSGRRPYASINFVTSHDGFSLQDLVSYNDKRNQANGEDNADGDNNNLSWNCGAEGPSDDPEVRALRERQKRNFMATLLLSQGVPMLRAGDELSHTQQGNNNAYCQDNEISWLDWELDDDKRAFLDFTRRMIRLRRGNPVLHRRRFFLGRRIRGGDVKDIAWLEPTGREMDDAAWGRGFVRCLGMRLEGVAMAETDENGEPVLGETLLVLLNAHHDDIRFRLPAPGPGEHWELQVDTAEPRREGRRFERRFDVRSRSVAVFGLAQPRPKLHVARPRRAAARAGSAASGTGRP